MEPNTTGVTQILVKGENITIRFGLPTCQAYSNMLLSEDSEKYFSGVDLLALGMAKLLFFAYENQCIVADQKPVLTLGAFMAFVEDVLTDNPKEAERIIKVFTDSRYTKVMVDKANEAIEEAKKKNQLTGNTLSLLHSMNSDLRENNTTLAPSGNLSSGNKATRGSKSSKKKPKKR